MTQDEQFWTMIYICAFSQRKRDRHEMEAELSGCRTSCSELLVGLCMCVCVGGVDAFQFCLFQNGVTHSFIPV